MAAPEARDFTSAIAAERAAVVSVVAVRPQTDMAMDDDEDARLQLFRQLNPGYPPAPPRTASRVDGSGLIISPDGHILTNAHVVDNASIIDVTLITGEEYPARLVGIDLKTDIAVLKIDARSLATATLGDSSAVQTGEWVAAIGAPFGFEQSVAVGVVSAVGRELPGEPYTPFIQTNLLLNPGNSGSPLIDLSGRVVGINAEVALRDGTYTGISFAIPIEIARSTATELIRSGHIDRAELGLGFQDLDPHLSRAFGFTPAAGVLVHTVGAGSPAEKAGLRVGDIILALNGRSLSNAHDLAAGIGSLGPGSIATVAYWRGGVRSEAQVRTVHSVKEEALPFPGPVRAASSARELLAVQALSADARRLLETDGYLIVLGLSEQAAAAGIEVGDIVLAVNTRAVRTQDELRRELAEDNDTVALLVDRNQERMFIAVPRKQADLVPSASVVRKQ